jgi:hypothetical protein
VAKRRQGPPAPSLARQDPLRDQNHPAPLGDAPRQPCSAHQLGEQRLDRLRHRRPAALFLPFGHRRGPRDRLERVVEALTGSASASH